MLLNEHAFLSLYFLRQHAPFQRMKFNDGFEAALSGGINTLFEVDDAIVDSGLCKALQESVLRIDGYLQQGNDCDRCCVALAMFI